jgi:hypothetical protein
VTGSASNRCTPAGVKVGVMGVQATELTAPQAIAGNTLTNAGKISGSIRWDAKLLPTPDGGIR